MSVSSVSLSRRWLMAGAGLALVGWMGIGFTLGAWLAPKSVTPTAAPSAAPTAPPSPTTSPWVVGQSAPWNAPLTTLTGQPTHLARGQKGTVVMAMASWCLYCGYEDRWVWPAFAKAHPQWAIDIVDVSPQGGIADPGPQSPPFSGHDGVGGSLSVTGMQAVMRQYVQTYHLAAPNIHVYVAPLTTQSAWHVASFPSIYVANSQGIVEQSTPGAITLAQAQALVP